VLRRDGLDVKMNFASAQDRTPEAERNNWTIKEQRNPSACCQRLPRAPWTMIRHLAMNEVSQLRLLPVKRWILRCRSPCAMLSQSNLGSARHCTVLCRVCAQANHDAARTESNNTRMLDAAHLRLAQSQQGGREILDLSSGKLVTWSAVHETPATDVVMRAIEAATCNQGCESLKFKSRRGVVSWSSAAQVGLQERIMMRATQTARG
jgi:hypothetical protein